MGGVNCRFMLGDSRVKVCITSPNKTVVKSTSAVRQAVYQKVPGP